MNDGAITPAQNATVRKLAFGYSNRSPRPSPPCRTDRATGSANRSDQKTASPSKDMSCAYSAITRMRLAKATQTSSARVNTLKPVLSRVRSLGAFQQHLVAEQVRPDRATDVIDTAAEPPRQHMPPQPTERNAPGDALIDDGELGRLCQQVIGGRLVREEA